MTALQANSSFSTITPSLQLAIDSTSLGAYKTCPRYYQYSVAFGYESKVRSVHLTFGILMHEGRELYYRLRWQKTSHDDALRQTIAWALQATWDSTLRRPWDSRNSIKNRLTLIRTLVWYLDKYGESDPLQTITLSDGRPAVEVSFFYHSGQQSIDGEEYLFCGHLDRLVQLNGKTYISDLKTTGHQLNQDWFDQFTPDNQFSMYLCAGKVAFPTEIDSLIVDGCQVLAGGSRFQRGIVARKYGQLEEWWAEVTEWWIPAMEHSARTGIYPANDKSCVSSDTIVTVTRGTRKGWKMPISRLFRMFHGISGGGRLDRSLVTYLLSDLGGYVGNNRVLDVIDKGIQEVFELKTANGFSIRATADHEFQTSSGWTRLDSLQVSNSILTYWNSRKSLEAHDKKENPVRGRIGKLYYYPSGYRVESKSVGMRNRRLGSVQRISRLQVEAKMNDLELNEFVYILREDKKRAETLCYLSSDFEVHHKNENCLDDSPSNVEALYLDEHKEKHNIATFVNKLGTTSVLSIEKIGLERVFDISMESPHNNFIANGLVAHNCHNYGGCPYRKVCSKAPASRQETLDREYTRRVWDPLQRRGDI